MQARSKQLLTIENAKTIKGEKLGYLTGILYLAPARESGVMDTCPMSTAGCRAGCLFTAGRASFTPSIITARINKTKWLHEDRTSFVDQLRKNIASLIRKAKRANLIPAVRINGTSDLPQLALQMAGEFPEVQFYDYSKLPRVWQRARANYHLTFSHSETNLSDCIDTLNRGINVAVVFNTPRSKPLPDTWHGFPVVNGDTHDLRFLDQHRIGLVIGLHAKGKAKKDKTGFVQIAPLGL